MARVYDYLRGGTVGNFEADRQLGDELARIYPPLRLMVRRNREWLGRVVASAATHGIRQFIDLGSGIPGSPAVHEIARDAVADPGSVRVAYVDTDPVALSCAHALLASGVTAIHADLADPGAVLGHKDVRALIDFAQPVCVLLAMVLHFWPADQARQIAAGYAERIAPGSAVAISVARNDDTAMFARLRASVSKVVELHNHGQADIESFFGGLDLGPPGVTVVRAWPLTVAEHGVRPDGPAYVLGGVGRKLQPHITT